jgi:4-carboxymuconolactone decarboxylase
LDYEQGMATRREVLGGAHVDRAVEATTELDAAFQRWITEAVWDGVWSRPGLERRVRSLITIALLAGLGHEELRLHLEAAPGLGVSPEEITEVLLHVGVYAGVPAANSAFKLAKQTYGGDSE